MRGLTVFASNSCVESKLLYDGKRLLFDWIQSGPTMVLDQRARKGGVPQPGMVMFGPLRAC
jgi:hypothetical protein